MERSRGKMLKIPKNVMQIGTGSPNVKLYMEDYVHTFLERCQGKETCLAFGQQEEKDGIRYYLIYGVEKKRTSGAEIFRIFRSWSGLEN